VTSERYLAVDVHLTGRLIQMLVSHISCIK
jgi:hypothetical protein